ncbi:MAG TPA: methyl-accepting chemotaxis protein, partial [Terriglobales bacterium]|nr:methyl-accepting chemotaxis protein [Terriglobales bacterium]
MLKRLKLGQKLIGAFLTVSLIAAMIGVFGIINLRKIDSAYAELLDDTATPLTTLSKISTSFQRVRINLRDAVMSQGKEQEAYANKVETLGGTITDELHKYEKYATNPDIKAAFEEFSNSRNAYREHIKEVIALAKAGKREQAMALLQGDGRVTAQAEQAALDKLEEEQTAFTKQKSDSMTAATNTTIIIMIVVTVIGVVVAIILGLVIVRFITGAMQQMKEAAESIAAGDLTHTVEYQSGDEIGSLAESFRGMTASWTKTLNRLAQSVTLLASSSDELSAVSNQMTSNAEETTRQADAVSAAGEQVSQNSQTVATATQEMTASIKEIAKNAH